MSENTLFGPPPGGSAPAAPEGGALYSCVLRHNCPGPSEPSGAPTNVGEFACSGPPGPVFTAASLAAFRRDVAAGLVQWEPDPDAEWSRPAPKWGPGGSQTPEKGAEAQSYENSLATWLEGGWTSGEPLPRVERPEGYGGSGRVGDEAKRAAARESPAARRGTLAAEDGPAERTVDFRERVYEWEAPLPAGHRTGAPRADAPWTEPSDVELLDGSAGLDDLRDLPLKLDTWEAYRARYGLAGPSVKTPELFRRYVELERHTMTFRSARHHAYAYQAHLATQGQKWRKATREECERANRPVGDEKQCLATWYENRARGQAERFAKTVTCGDDEISYACPERGCSCAGVSTVGCSVGRVCVACRAKQARRRQARFGEARISVLDELEEQWPVLMNPRNRNRYSEKFTTLATPNCPIDPVQRFSTSTIQRVAKGLNVAPSALDLRLKQFYGEEFRIVALRIDVIFRAWRFFTVELYRFLERSRADLIGLTPTGYRKARKARREWEAELEAERAAVEWRIPMAPLPREQAVEEAARAWRVPLVRPCLYDVELPPFHLHRSFEWTVGNNGIGHPHFHVWMLGPKLPGRVEPETQEAYAEALRAWSDADPETRGAMPSPPKIQMLEWWRRALKKAGMQVKDDDDLVFNLKELKPRRGSQLRKECRENDIRAELIKNDGKNLKYERAARLVVHGSAGEDAIRYADGWCVVDRDQTGYAPAAMIARVYEALDGRRLTQASRGFLARATTAAQSGCKVHKQPLQTQTYPGGVPDGVRKAIESRQRPREAAPS